MEKGNHECKTMDDEVEIYFETADWNPGWVLKKEVYDECPPTVTYMNIKFCPFCGEELK
jgi:hypothetical protein